MRKSAPRFWRGAWQIFRDICRGCTGDIMSPFRTGNAQFIVKINAHMEGDVNNGALAQFLERQKEISRELLKVDVFPYMAVLTIKGAESGKKYTVCAQ